MEAVDRRPPPAALKKFSRDLCGCSSSERPWRRHAALTGQASGRRCRRCALWTSWIPVAGHDISRLLLRSTRFLLIFRSRDHCARPRRSGRCPRLLSPASRGVCASGRTCPVKPTAAAKTCKAISEEPKPELAASDEEGEVHLATLGRTNEVEQQPGAGRAREEMA